MRTILKFGGDINEDTEKKTGYYDHGIPGLGKDYGP